jgi:hypothetical protein
MLLLTIGLTAGTISAVVVGDHMLEIERSKVHMVFLYAVMLALVFATVTAQMSGALG